MKFKKERTVTMAVQTGLTLLVLVLFLVIGGGWQTQIACGLATIVLVSAVVAYAVSYKALLPGKDYAYAFGFGYLGLLLIWVYCTLLFYVGIDIAAYLGCHPSYESYADCVGTVHQSLGMLLVVFLISGIYAIFGSILGGLIAMLTKYIYQKIEK